MISPALAYSTMLRATSEMAAAMSVASAPSKPISVARERPFWRAVTMSRADMIGTRVSFAITKVPLQLPVQISQAFLQVQRRANPLEGQAQLHHGKGHVGLNAHDDRLSPAQPKHVRNGAQRARGEGINDIQHSHINDDAARAKMPNFFGQVIAQQQQVLIREHRLNAGDQVIALFENWDMHDCLANQPAPRMMRPARLE